VRIAVLIPAHNEAGSIADTLVAILDQSRPADLVVVAANGCTDDTAEIARQFPVTVLELPRLPHRKSQALNIAWAGYCQDADLVVCLDADTVLTPDALEDWEKEFRDNPLLAGSASKFTVYGKGFLARMQRAEFAQWTDYLLRRKGQISVLSGTASCLDNSVLRTVAKTRQGPWSYDSQVEDFELTYQIRQMGFDCAVSPTVRAYTDSMPSLRALWGQRMKWQAGTVEDLWSFGYNKYTKHDWRMQLFGWLGVLSRLIWFPWIAFVATHGIHFDLRWQVLMILFAASAFRQSFLIPHRDWKDTLLAATLLPNELFGWIRAAWFVKAWFAVIAVRVFKRSRQDRWAAQYIAEGVN
jgi:biofilm PGA synthesis N-glycosyltransferase PgaC